MKSDGLLKHAAIAFGIAVIVYALAYLGIEHRRKHQGPWQVTFMNDPAGAALVINQPALAITNVQIVFPGEAPPATDTTLALVEPRDVPFPTPVGRCVFLDLTSLPGTMVLEVAGHEIQLIPRVLTIDKKEFPWQAGATITLSRTNLLQSPTSRTTSNN